MLKTKCESKEIPFDFEFVIKNKNNSAVKNYFYKYYLKLKMEADAINEKIIGDKIYDDTYFAIMRNCSLNKTKLIINDISLECDITENKKPEFNSGIQMMYFVYDKPNSSSEEHTFIKIAETLKYKITSKYLNHPFEIFRINSEEFFSCIARFHEPCVRVYIKDKKCYLLPSAISSYHLFTNLDFKYFVGSHDPISIINKYRNRGYGTIFNKTEINQFLSYILAFPNYKKMYGINEDKDINKILGPLDPNHEFFKPRKNIPEEYPVDTSISPNYLTIKTAADDIIKHYQKLYPKYSSELLLKRTIAMNGQVEPVKKWMIDAAFDLLSGQ